MLFNSSKYLFFFPVVVLLYFIIPKKFRYLWLLVCSYYFYMSWNAYYVLLILFSSIVTWVSGLLIGSANKLPDLKKQYIRKKLFVALCFIINLGILMFFKYGYFIIDNINTGRAYWGMGAVTPTFDILLPVGISFYTFQVLGYIMDIYRGEIVPEKNFARYALFVSFFPQLIAGPIERSKNLLMQLKDNKDFEWERTMRGLLLIAWGLFQKMIIADRAAIIVNTIYNNYQQYAGYEIMVAMFLFAIQIYCDFSAYSDIAIGSAQVFGINLIHNFKQPYFSRSIAEFWRRWHISLSTWFRDYLYIPLGGNRKGKLRKYINLLIVFLVSGLWHGASWTFVIWGGIHGLFQIIGEVTKPARQYLCDKIRIKRESLVLNMAQVFITFTLVTFAWVFFRAPDIHAAFGILEKLSDLTNPWILFDGSLFTLGLNQKEYQLMTVAIGILFVITFFQTKKVDFSGFVLRQELTIRWCIYFIIIMALTIFGVYGREYELIDFIYFQF